MTDTRTGVAAAMVGAIVASAIAGGSIIFDLGGQSAQLEAVNATVSSLETKVSAIDKLAAAAPEYRQRILDRIDRTDGRVMLNEARLSDVQLSLMGCPIPAQPRLKEE